MIPSAAPLLSRRRFIAISGAAITAASTPASAAPLTHWRGIALGASASLTLSHPEADRLIAAVLAEVARLENIFSLYRTDSALVQLNASGSLDAPPHELVECLGLVDAIHAATEGAFDPTVQPLWAAYAEAYGNGRAPDLADLAAARALIGWDAVEVSPQRVAFARPGMALTLNGIAQGYVADRVATLLATEGLDNILVDMGELSALGGDPRGGDWQVGLPDGRGVGLRDRALATSAPLGTVFDTEGRMGHILQPHGERSASGSSGFVTIAAPQASVADALSTAACLLEPSERLAAVAKFRGAVIVADGLT